MLIRDAECGVSDKRNAATDMNEDHVGCKLRMHTSIADGVGRMRENESPFVKNGIVCLTVNGVVRTANGRVRNKMIAEHAVYKQHNGKRR